MFMLSMSLISKAFAADSIFGRDRTAGRDVIESDAMPSKKKAPENSDYAVGDRVKVNLHTGRIVDATVKSVIERTGGKRLQVDFGKDETALVYLWQVIEKAR
jgi:hypothetical protein